MDGKWRSYYVCLACMDKWLKETLDYDYTRDPINQPENMR